MLKPNIEELSNKMPSVKIALQNLFNSKNKQRISGIQILSTLSHHTLFASGNHILKIQCDILEVPSSVKIK